MRLKFKCLTKFVKKPKNYKLFRKEPLIQFVFLTTKTKTNFIHKLNIPCLSSSIFFIQIFSEIVLLKDEFWRFLLIDSSMYTNMY